MKKITNLDSFKNILPYSSEIFGVYQPLLGWKSTRIEARIRNGFNADKSIRARELFQNAYNQYEARYEGDIIDTLEIESIDIGQAKQIIKKFDTEILNEISYLLYGELARAFGLNLDTNLREEDIPNDIWGHAINPELLAGILNTSVREKIQQWAFNLAQELYEANLDNSHAIVSQALQDRLNRESITAAILLDLVRNEQYSRLYKIFYNKKLGSDISALSELEEYQDPFDLMDPKKDLDRVGLSPIGIVHLFRQYFFEFDSFLGVPVGHIWISPGSTVELIEVSTRKTITEKLIEIESGSIIKSESSVTIEDELSDAVKEDNKNDIKFGSNVNAKENWVFGSASQSASFDMNTTQQTAREQAHKHMRKQSDKLATEIRKNYKSTFKTVTEETETSSKRYVLTNTSEELINYELRRKMRQVGVQVQDIGTYLCWQTYVDNPGEDLGVAQLLHIAKSPDLDKITHPEEIVSQKAYLERRVITIPYVGDLSENDEVFKDGVEQDDGLFDETDTIQYLFPRTVACEKPNYYLEHQFSNHF